MCVQKGFLSVSFVFVVLIISACSSKSFYGSGNEYVNDIFVQYELRENEYLIHRPYGLRFARIDKPKRLRVEFYSGVQQDYFTQSEWLGAIEERINGSSYFYVVGENEDLSVVIELYDSSTILTDTSLSCASSYNVGALLSFYKGSEFIGSTIITGSGRAAEMVHNHLQVCRPSPETLQKARLRGKEDFIFYIPEHLLIFYLDRLHNYEGL